MTKIRVTVNKTAHGYSVTQFNFDERGNTIFHNVHAASLTYREAHDLKKQILADWVG